VKWVRILWWFKVKVYLAIKYHADHSNRDRIEGITAVLHELGHETYCVTRDLEHWGVYAFTPQDLMQKSFNVIDTSDVLFVDLTEKGVGVGIEAGYAYARRIPIIVIAQGDVRVSETLRGISQRMIRYNHMNDLADALLCMTAGK
jgi:nucleoside 2-deoxyribosyltransferase